MASDSLLAGRLAIYKYETGKKIPSKEQLQKLHEYSVASFTIPPTFAAQGNRAIGDWSTGDGVTGVNRLITVITMGRDALHEDRGPDRVKRASLGSLPRQSATRGAKSGAAPGSALCYWRSGRGDFWGGTRTWFIAGLLHTICLISREHSTCNLVAQSHCRIITSTGTYAVVAQHTLHAASDTNSPPARAL